MTTKEEIIQICVDNGINKDIASKAIYAKKYERILPKHKRQSFKGHNLFTENQYKFCMKLYYEYNLPIYKIAMMYGISDVGLGRIMKENKENTRGHNIGKNSQNTFFQIINRKDKAYFLGLLAADGSVVSKKKNHSSTTLSLCLKKEDQYILQEFIDRAKLDTEVKYDNYIRNKEEKQRNTIAYIRINSVNMCNDLVKYGIIQNKSNKNSIFIPNIRKDLIPHFIRGYFDGDGIAFSDGKIGFCGSEKIIHQIKDYLCHNLDITNNNINYNKFNSIYYIQWSKKYDTYQISNFLYKRCDNLFLKRKRCKIDKNYSLL